MNIIQNQLAHQSSSGISRLNASNDVHEQIKLTQIADSIPHQMLHTVVTIIFQLKIKKYVRWFFYPTISRINTDTKILNCHKVFQKTSRQ